MASISDVVSGSVLIQDKAATAPSFGIIGCVAYHDGPPAVITVNCDPSGLSALEDEGFVVGTEPYEKLSAILRQDIAAEKFKVYRRTAANAQTVTMVPLVTEEDYVYDFSFVCPDGVRRSVTYTVLASATQTTIATALNALITALTGIDSTASTITMTVVPTTAGTRFYLDTKPGDFTVKDTSTDAGIATALAAAAAADPDFYGVVTDGYSEAEINAAAAWCEANKKIYIALTNDSDVLTAATTDIASDLKAAGYNRCGVLASCCQSAQMATAMMGRQFGMRPGSSDWNNKTLSGTADDYTSTQQGHAVGKNVSLFLVFPQFNATFNVMAASGRLYDTTRDIDWFNASVAAAEFTVLVRNEKVPYNKVGKGLVRGAFEQVAGVAEEWGVFEPGSTKFTVPKDGADLPADKIARLLRHGFTADKTVGISKITYQGVVNF